MAERIAVPLIYRRHLVDHESFKILRGVRDFLGEHACEPICMAEVADRACYSRFHFHRQFQRAFGETPHQFLIRQRLERAKALLKGNSLSVSDICLEVGYQSLGSFSALFARLEGVSPTEYRRIYGFPQLWPRKIIPACMGQMYGAFGASAGLIRG